MTAAVEYQRSERAQGHFWGEVQRLIHGGARRWCDVGGGAKPVLNSAQIDRWQLDYVLLDISQAELDRAPAGYGQFCGSILEPAVVAELLARGGSFDAVVSRWTAEHVSDGRRFHESVFDLLAPGGRALHFFPTLYSLPFLVNRLLPARLSGALLSHAQSGREVKFPPHYDWCRGPSARQIQRLEAIGYSVERYVGYFGHRYYDRLAPLRTLQRRLNHALLKHPLPALTSFALVVLERPR